MTKKRSVYVVATESEHSGGFDWFLTAEHAAKCFQDNLMHEGKDEPGFVCVQFTYLVDAFESKDEGEIEDEIEDCVTDYMDRALIARFMRAANENSSIDPDFLHSYGLWLNRSRNVEGAVALVRTLPDGLDFLSSCAPEMVQLVRPAIERDGLMEALGIGASSDNEDDPGHGL